jgi:hypothetical protein
MKAAWRLSEWASRLLEPAEREAVLGDLTEAGGGLWLSCVEVVDLVLRRHAGHWKNWRPWVAAFGISVPTSFLFMGDSVALCAGFVKLAGDATCGNIAPGIMILALKALVLTGWSWTCGYLVGDVSGRTLWCSILAYGSPCLFCLSRFRIESLSRSSLLLFVFPLAVGIWHGLRGPRVGSRMAVCAASIITLLAVISEVCGPGGTGNACSWIGSVVLTCPAWFLAIASLAVTKESAKPERSIFEREQHESI